MMPKLIPSQEDVMDILKKTGAYREGHFVYPSGRHTPREILRGVEHRQSRYLNNRCENSHRPTRQREYRMQRFKSAGHAQRFLSAYGPITQHFRPRRHRLSAPEYRQEMRQRFESWADITGTKRAA